MKRGLVLGLLGGPGVASAHSCDALLGDLRDFAAADTAYSSHTVAFTMVGNREPSDWVQYTKGELDWWPGWSGDGSLFLGRLATSWEEPATQYFSDRYEGGSFFSRFATDQLGVSFVDDPGAGLGDVTLTWLSWGSPSATYETECVDNYLTVFLGSDQMLVFTFEPWFHYISPWPW